jgi:aminopeptidase-like protein
MTFSGALADPRAAGTAAGRDAEQGLLHGLASDDGSVAQVRALWPLMRALYPLCRSITGNGVRRTLDLVEQWVPLERSEVPTGTKVFDWEIPNEWNIRDAYIADRHGKRLVDFREHNLHVMSYSAPVRRSMTLEELRPHLYSLPERPDWIPYRTTYYREHWGFCLRHRDLERLGPGPFEVVIDSSLAPGSLTYAECVVPGGTGAEGFVYTHTCHPSLANENLTGIAVAAALAREMLNGKRPRLTWRFVFGPATIGSLTWLARNEDRLSRVRAGLVIGLLGDAGPVTYKRSRRGDSATDRAASHVLRGVPSARIVDFEPYGYDERQFCSPGIDLPVGRFTRSPNGQYPEYHSSADNLDILRPAALAESLRALARLVALLDQNRRLINLSPKGEPRLGKRGLYGSVGGVPPGDFEHALLWVLSYSDRSHDLLWIAERSGLGFARIAQAAAALEGAGLVRDTDAAGLVRDSDQANRGDPL